MRRAGIVVAVVVALLGCHRGERCVESHKECVCACMPTGGAAVCLSGGGMEDVCDRWEKVEP